MTARDETFGGIRPEPFIGHIAAYGNNPLWVYTHLAADGTVLYVGCSTQPETRLKAHRNSSPWFDRVDDIRYLGPFHAREGWGVEERMIREHRPVHNKQHNNCAIEAFIAERAPVFSPGRTTHQKTAATRGDEPNEHVRPSLRELRSPQLRAQGHRLPLAHGLPMPRPQIRPERAGPHLRQRRRTGIHPRPRRRPARTGPARRDRARPEVRSLDLRDARRAHREVVRLR